MVMVAASGTNWMALPTPDPTISRPAENCSWSSLMSSLVMEMTTWRLVVAELNVSSSLSDWKSLDTSERGGVEIEVEYRVLAYLWQCLDWWRV